MLRMAGQPRTAQSGDIGASFQPAGEGRGMSIIWFESQEALDAQLPMIKEFQNVLAEKFQGRAVTQKGVTSPNLQFGD